MMIACITAKLMENYPADMLPYIAFGDSQVGDATVEVEMLPGDLVMITATAPSLIEAVEAFDEIRHAGGWPHAHLTIQSALVGMSAH